MGDEGESFALINRIPGIEGKVGRELSLAPKLCTKPALNTHQNRGLSFQEEARLGNRLACYLTKTGGQG